jgi:hypothetical protein
MVISRRSQKFFQSQAVIMEKQARTGDVHHSIEMKSMQNAHGTNLIANPSVDRPTLN